jgi:polysaccharide biosynthesis protein PelE
MLDKLTQMRTFIPKVFSCVVAAGMEGISGAVLWQLDNNIYKITGFLLLHLAASLILASSFTGLLPLAQRNSGRRTAFFIFSLCFFMPWFGMVGIIGALLPVLWWPKPRTDGQARSAWSYLSIAPLPDRSPSAHKRDLLHYGVASIMNELHGASDLEQRQQKVLTTLRLRDNEAIPLLRRALRDPEDDVRLLAYALLDRKEEAITARIRLHQKQLATVKPEQRFNHHNAIAHDCWELIHVGLVQGEVMQYLLQMARTHAEEALAFRPQNAGLQFLLGKLLARTGDVNLASEAFQLSEQLGIDREIVNAQLAEIGHSHIHPAEPDEQARGGLRPAMSQSLQGAVAN